MTKEKQSITKFFFEKPSESYLIFLGKRDPGNISELFSIEEWKKVQDNKIPIHYSSLLIHMDDSILTIKQKITYASRELSIFNMEEIYLYGICSYRLSALAFYKNITNNDKPLLKTTLVQVLRNLSDINEEIDAKIQDILSDPFFIEKDEFTYEDIMYLELFKTNMCKTQIGHQYINKQSKNRSIIYPIDPLFSCNPFDLLNMSSFQITKQDLVFSNSDFLFKYTGNEPRFFNNTIYVCLAKDVLKFAIENNIDESYILRMYYPLLWEKQITSASELETSFSWREASLKKTMDPSQIEEYAKIDLFESIYFSSPAIDFSQQGIKSFYIVLHPETNSVFPLEMIFKNIHADKNIPFIQYNPGTKQENLYRMYHEKKAQNGKKIPFVSKETIFFLLSLKQTVKTQSITLFVSQEQNNFVRITLERNGNIHIQGELKNAHLPALFETWVYRFVEKSMTQIKEFMTQIGYFIKTFDNIRDPYIEIIDLQYIWSLELKRKLGIDKLTGCISPLLYREYSENETYRYKRVQYFKPMNPQEECIAELLRFTRDKGLIAAGIKTRFPDLSTVQIQTIMAEYSDKHQNVAGRFINKTIEVMENPGFQVSFEQCTLGNECTIRINQISSYAYVDVLSIYFDSIIRLSQFPDTIPPEYLSICKSTKKTKELIVSVPKIVTAEPIFIDEPPEFLDIDYDMDLYNIEEQSVGQSSEEQTGGGEDDSKSDSNEDDPKIGKKTVANYFNKRMKQKNPMLLKSSTGYVRVCSTEQKRQPVIITEDEKKRIDEKYKDNKPYTHALNYGVDNKQKPLYYICPRYWCTKPGMEQPMTEEEVKEKKCGEIIRNPKNIKPGEYVYESTGATPDPGFINRGKQTVYDKDGKEICYPCCFKDWDSNLQKKMRQKCVSENAPTTDTVSDTTLSDIVNLILPKPAKTLKISREQYVLDANKYPLPMIGRIGIIPVPIQFFLNIVSDHTSCIKDNIPKDNCPMLLRYGVEQYPNQSFIGCIADLYAYKLNRMDVVTVPKMREIIASSISIDYFVQMQNGSMTSLFQPTNKEFIDVPIYKYDNSELYKRLNMKDPAHISFFKTSVISFENFLAYLRDNNAKIDHTYLWEIVTKPHPDLFKNGLNLVILEIKNQDITNNVELLCPTAPYTIPLFSESKEIALLIKQDEIFEPIYLFERNSTSTGALNLKFTKTFSDKTRMIGQLPTILKMIDKLTNSHCGPFMEPRIGYKFKRNIHASQIKELITKNKIPIEIKSQVLNQQGKIIGFLVKWKGDPEILINDADIFLPVFPSSSLDIHTEWMDNPNLWTDYVTTTSVLKKIHELSGKTIPCKPVYRILENHMVVGILTETNQFIQIEPPMENIGLEDGLTILEDSDYLIQDTPSYVSSDRNILTKSPEKLQDKMVRSIYLENQFYNSFRSTFRMVLNLYKYRDLRKKMILLFKQRKIYSQKLKQMIKWLKEMMSDMVLFQDYAGDVLDSLVDIYTCNTDCENKKYCLLKQGSLCQLIIPKTHLVSGKSNEELYYGRMADELLRHRRTHLFMFYPDTYLNISTNSDYKIYEQEILLPKSALLNSSDYFKDLTEFPTTYSTKNTFEQTNPSKPIPPAEWIWTQEL